MSFVQQDMTDVERENIRVVTSDEYQAGIDMGWRLAESYYFGAPENCDDRAERRWRDAGSPAVHQRGNNRPEES